MKNIFYLILSFFLIVEWGCSFEEEQADALRPDANSKVQNTEVIASFEKWGIANPTSITKSNRIFAVTNRTGENNISLFEINHNNRVAGQTDRRFIPVHWMQAVRKFQH